MKAVTLIFPHQLFENHPALMKGRTVVLIEDALFFEQYRFHKNKLVLHRASMKQYAKNLTDRGLTSRYIDAKDHLSLDTIFKSFRAEKIEQIHYCDTTDYLLERRIQRYAIRNKLKIAQHSNPNFICTPSYLDSYFNQRKRYFLTEFYIEQRKRFDILTNEKEPQGGQWTYDTENRKKMPASVVPPTPATFRHDKFVKEAISYVNNYFNSNYGTTDKFNFPITTAQARTVLNDFLENRFTHFGIYQDALVKENSTLFHSLLTSCLNIGLLTPQEILDLTIAYGARKKIPINSLEGFIRQILGWREFMRAVYQREGVFQRTNNHWQHSKKIPLSFWNGSTGIAPVDNVISKLIDTGYCNHIERLMVMGNFMLLCEFDPDEVYQWFMEMFIDSYDWVMVPNVYGMSQFADGGKMSTKPYISGSNYLLKMSNYPKGDWCEVWDALYWRFIEKHKNEFIKNPRMSMMVKQLDKMEKEKYDRLKMTAKKFLSTL
ncbi:cryptochrome/photolyase family protein [soil metagenome]